MLKAKLNELIRLAQERKLALRQDKGHEYTKGSEDVLANFKGVGSQFGMTPAQAWGVYAQKHWDAIGNYCIEGKERSNEPIEGRIDDLQVYLDLFRGLVWEMKERGREKDQPEIIYHRFPGDLEK